jgi:rubrerythrin
MDEFYYKLECPICDSVLDLYVTDLDEIPAFCPMCGTATQEWEESA